MENLRKTDSEFMERFEHFAFEEGSQEEGQRLDGETRWRAVLATLLGCQGTDAYQVMLPKALDAGLSPVQAKEIVYQSFDHLGMSWVWPFLEITNKILEEQGVVLLLPSQATTTMEGSRSAQKAFYFPLSHSMHKCIISK